MCCICMKIGNWGLFCHNLGVLVRSWLYICRVKANLCFCILACECWCNRSWFFPGKLRIYYFGSLTYFWGASQPISHELRSM